MRVLAAVKRVGGLAVVMALTACGSSSEPEDDAFAYSEQDFREAVLGKWQSTVVLYDGDLMHFSLTLEQTPGSDIESGDGHRVLPLVGTLTSDDEVLNTSASGSADAWSQLNSFDLDLDLASGLEVFGSIEGRLMDNGVLTGGRYSGRVFAHR